MASHDNYDKDILKALKRIATSLDKIEKYLNSNNVVEKCSNNVVEKCSNCKFQHFSGYDEPCKSCIPKKCDETGTRHMTGFQRKKEE